VVDGSSPARWTGPRPFVGREEVLGRLREELVSAMEHSGRAVILHGPRGSGRVSLARRLVAPARQGAVRIAFGDAADPDEPAWSQIAHQLTVRRRALRAVARTASKWIGVIPLVGGTFEAVIDTVQTLRRDRGGAPETAADGNGSTVDHVRLLLSESPMEPRLIVLENLEASDPSEMAGAFALAQRIGGTRTLFIATSTSTGGRLPKDVALLRDEIVRYGNGDELAIPPLTPDECLGAVEKATGSPLPDPWRLWLKSRAPGTPEALWELLGELAARDVLVRQDAKPDSPTWSWTRLPVPSDDVMVAIRDDEVADLPTEEKQVLAAAAQIGGVFEVGELADRIGMPELELQECLDRLVRRGRLRFDGTEETDGVLVDRYAFRDIGSVGRWAARSDLLQPLGDSCYRR
jgi:hypothetical protein